MPHLAKLPFRKAMPVCTAMSAIWMSRGLFLLHCATSRMPNASCLQDPKTGGKDPQVWPGCQDKQRHQCQQEKISGITVSLTLASLNWLPFSSYFLQVPELFVLFDPEFPEILDPDLFPGGKPRNWMPAPHVEKEKAATFTCCLLPACWVWHWPAGWGSLIHGQDWYIKQAGNDKMQAGSNLIISLTTPSGLVISAP